MCRFVYVSQICVKITLAGDMIFFIQNTVNLSIDVRVALTSCWAIEFFAILIDKKQILEILIRKIIFKLQKIHNYI